MKLSVSGDQRSGFELSLSTSQIAEVNSSHWDCKVVNHEKIAMPFFSQGKFNSSKLLFSTIYPYSIHPLYTYYYQNKYYLYSKLHQKMEKMLRNSQKKFRWSKNLVTLGVFIAKRISNDDSNAALKLVFTVYNISLKITRAVQWIYVWILIVHILTKIRRKLSNLVKFKSRYIFSYKIFEEDYLLILLIKKFVETIPLQYGNIYTFILFYLS